MSVQEIRNPMLFFQQVVTDIVKDNKNHKFHVGKILLNSMRRNPRKKIAQIDAATGDQDSLGELLDKSISLARAFRKIGLGVGDVVTVMGRNNIDIAVPMYAAMFTGVAFNGVDGTLQKAEMETLLRFSRPKLVFCERYNLSMLDEISQELGFKIVSFKRSPYHRHPGFKEFLEKNNVYENYDDFKATDFDPNVTTAFIICTSGTLGLPKLVDVTHANICPVFATIPTSIGPMKDYAVYKSVICLAPIYWMTSIVFHVLSAMYGITKVQSSAPPSPQHIAEVVNKYKPSLMALTPSITLILLKRPEMDWRCLHTFFLAGCTPSKELIETTNSLIGRPATVNVYGLTECCGQVFYMGDNSNGTLGVPIPGVECKIVDQETGKVLGDNEIGELYVRGQNVFRGYYNNEEATKEAFSDGWFKTGDLMYRNSNKHYCYVDRLKVMIDVYLDGTHYHVSPEEIEIEIAKMSGVLEAVVVGVKRKNADDDSSQLLALVVRNNGHTITADDVKQHVKNKLSPSKWLTGGVVFLDSLPMKSIGKLDRRKIKEIADEYYDSMQS